MGDKRKAWKTFSRIGFGYGAFLFVTFILQLGMGLIAAVLLRFGVNIIYGDWFMLVVSLVDYVAGGVITYFIVRGMPVFYRPEKRKARAGMLVVAFFVCISALYLGNLIGQALMGAVNLILGRPMINPVEEALQGLSMGAVFMITVVMAPICEELLFRKLLIDRIKQYGDKAAIVVSAFVFGFSHGNFYQFFYAFGIGLVFAYIYIRTGSIHYTILFHMLINFLGSIVVLSLKEHVMLLAVYSIGMLGMAVAGTILFFYYKKRLILESGIEEIWGKGNFRIIFLNVGMLLFFLASASIFVISEIV